MNEKDIAFILIREGVLNQRSNPANYTEANENPAVKAVGRTVVASTLEYLSKKEIVGDFQSTFGDYGHGFAYRISPSLIKQLSDDDAIHGKINDLFELKNMITEILTELISNYSDLNINLLYKEDLLRSMEELKICYINGCYIACFALCEQILDIALIKIIDDKKTTFDYSWMQKDPQFVKYFDQPLTEKAMVINLSRRITRKKAKVSAPTQYQAAMEIQSVIDTLKNIIGQLSDS